MHDLDARDRRQPDLRRRASSSCQRAGRAAAAVLGEYPRYVPAPLCLVNALHITARGLRACTGVATRLTKVALNGSHNRRRRGGRPRIAIGRNSTRFALNFRGAYGAIPARLNRLRRSLERSA